MADTKPIFGMSFFKRGSTGDGDSRKSCYRNKKKSGVLIRIRFAGKCNDIRYEIRI